MINARKPRFLTRKTLLAAALGTVMAPGAMAQLEEVIVTAQKREQSVQDVPGSVAAFSEEMLEKSQTRNFDDLSQIASGIEVTPSSDGFGSVIKIRGVGNNAFAPSIRPAVGIFLDEIPLGSSESAYNNMADIERVEILKGPQATLFGKEVSAGAISLFTKRPDTQAMDGYIEGNFGNYGLQEYRIGGNVPLGDTFAIRASAYSNERDGTVKNIVLNEDVADRDADGYRLRLGWEPTDNFTAILGYEDHDINVVGSTSAPQQYGDLWEKWEQSVEGITDPADSKLVVLDPYDYKTNSAGTTDRETTTEIWSLHIEWALNEEWSFSSVTSDQEYLLETRGVDGWGSSLRETEGGDIPGLNSAPTAVGPYQISDFIQDQGTDTFTQEFRFTYEGENWSSIIGAFYAETDLSSIVDFNQLALILGPTNIYAPGLSVILDDSTEWALFTHNIYTIREGLDLTFGLRYAEVEKDAQKGQPLTAGVFAGLAHPLIPVSDWADDIPKQKDTWDEVTGTIKMTYWLNDEVSMYFGWDRGFKAGGHNVCKEVDGDAFCFEPFDSELADNYEIGIKGRLFDQTLVLNAAAFYQQYDDYQVEVQDDEGIGNSILNAASVEIEGVEMDFQWLATDKLLIDGNASYIDSRWDDYDNAGCLRPQYQLVACTEDANGNFTQDLSGKRLNYAPLWTANLNATWSDDFDNGMSWYVRGEVSFKDDRYFFPDLDPELRDGSYHLFNASMGLTGAEGNWDVILWAKNITNEEYLPAASRNRDATQFLFPGTEGWRAGAGLDRTYGATLKYRIGDY